MGLTMELKKEKKEDKGDPNYLITVMFLVTVKPISEIDTGDRKFYRIRVSSVLGNGQSSYCEIRLNLIYLNLNWRIKPSPH